MSRNMNDGQRPCRYVIIQFFSESLIPSYLGLATARIRNNRLSFAIAGRVCPTHRLCHL